MMAEHEKLKTSKGLGMDVLDHVSIIPPIETAPTPTSWPPVMLEY